MHTSVQISDEFDDPHGHWHNYDSYDPQDRLRIYNQKHVDIRSFTVDKRSTEWRMLNFDQSTMEELDALDMTGMGGTRTQLPGESWTLGTVGRQADRKNWPGLTLECPPGETATESIIGHTVQSEPDVSIATNLVPTPSFENGLGPWTTSGPANVTSFGVSAAWAASGSQSARLVTTHTGAQAKVAGHNAAMFDVIPGEAYSVACETNVIAIASGGTVGIRIDWYDENGSFLSSSPVVTKSTVGTARLVNEDVESPGGAVLGVASYVHNAATGGTIDSFFDAVIAVQGGDIYDYFDGDRVGYRWLGVPHSSPSRGPYLVEAQRIDIQTDFDDGDFLSIALPAFPLASIDIGDSFVDLTDADDGNFNDPHISIPLSTSLVPLVAGDSEFRVSRSLISSLPYITGVRFRIQATAQCTFRAMAIRLLGKDWKYTHLDLDTRLEVLRQTVAPNGSITRAYDYTFPTLFRAGEPAGTNDPKPINMSMAATIFTGSKVNTNSVTLIFREGPGDFTQQQDLNGLPMSQLNGDPQPDLVSLSFKGRSQNELNRFRQVDLGDDTQTEIERTIDPTIRSYLSGTLQWSPSMTTVTLLNSEGTPGSDQSNGFTFSDVPTLVANSFYLFVVDVEDKSMRGRVYPLDHSGNIKTNEALYDSGLVLDEFSYMRRPGRYGWRAQIQDGDAYVDALRVRSQTYAEITTAAFESITPVEGAELAVVGSGNLNFFNELYEADFLDYNVQLSRDHDQTLSGLSYKVVNPGTLAPQGVMTNLADFYDFEQMEVSFDLFYPQTALDDGIELEVFLSNEYGRIVPLEIGTVLPNRWQTVRVTPGNIEAQTGRYRLYIVQSNTGVPSTWWVDNIKIEERVLSFYGRSVFEDPWHDAKIDWVPFRNTVNRDGGVQFLQRGYHLQVKGKAHRPDSFIRSLKVIPKYAQLGRFVWEEDELYNPLPPIASFTTNVTGRTVVFDATGSSDPDGDVLNYFWNFGDGYTQSGPIVTHRFARNAEYTASLIVTDRNGLRDRTETTLTVLEL